MEAGRDGRLEQVDLVNQEAGREAAWVKQVTVVPFLFYFLFFLLFFPFCQIFSVAFTAFY